MTRTLNGITRDLRSDGDRRWAYFNSEQQCYCWLRQSADIGLLTMASCRFSWVSSNPGGDTVIEADLLVEALHQAVELARKWNQDTGKPVQDVLK